MACAEAELWTRFQEDRQQGKRPEMAAEGPLLQRDEADWLVPDGLHALLCRHYR